MEVQARSFRGFGIVGRDACEGLGHKQVHPCSGCYPDRRCRHARRIYLPAARRHCLQATRLRARSQIAEDGAGRIPFAAESLKKNGGLAFWIEDPSGSGPRSAWCQQPRDGVQGANGVWRPVPYRAESFAKSTLSPAIVKIALFFVPTPSQASAFLLAQAAIWAAQRRSTLSGLRGGPGWAVQKLATGANP